MTLEKPAASVEAPRSTPTGTTLRPRRKLFYALLAVFAAWILALIVLYLKTVYPLRY